MLSSWSVGLSWTDLLLSSSSNLRFFIWVVVCSASAFIPKSLCNVIWFSRLWFLRLSVSDNFFPSWTFESNNAIGDKFKGEITKSSFFIGVSKLSSLLAGSDVVSYELSKGGNNLDIIEPLFGKGVEVTGFSGWSNTETEKFSVSLLLELFAKKVEKSSLFLAKSSLISGSILISFLCTFLLWTLSKLFRVKLLSHESQLNLIFSWTDFLWAFKFPKLAKFLSHISHFLESRHFVVSISPLFSVTFSWSENFSDFNPESSNSPVSISISCSCLMKSVLTFCSSKLSFSRIRLMKDKVGNSPKLASLLSNCSWISSKEKLGFFRFNSHIQFIILRFLIDIAWGDSSCKVSSWFVIPSFMSCSRSSSSVFTSFLILMVLRSSLNWTAGSFWTSSSSSWTSSSSFWTNPSSSWTSLCLSCAFSMWLMRAFLLL